MFKFLRNLFSSREAVHFIPNATAELELSDGDKAAIHGWPDKTVKEVTQHDQQRR